MKYNFDKVINRQNTNAMSVSGYKEYLFNDAHIKLPYSDEQYISMWIADMQFSTAPEILSALRTRVDQQIFGYSQIEHSVQAGIFLDWCKSRYNWSFNPEHLVYSPGVVPALFDTIEYLCQADEKVLIFTPSYGLFKHAADGNNIELIESPLIIKDGEYCMDFDDLEKKLIDEKISLCLFCSPHNPTGRIWKDDELKKFGQLCLDNNVSIVADEIHCDLLRTGKTFTPLAKLFPESDKIITCMAPSKTFNLAGMMLAHIIIPNKQLRYHWQEKHFAVYNPLSITAVQAAYLNGSNWLKALCHYLDSNFDYLQNYLNKHLSKALFKIPDATYLAWIDVSAYFQNDENLTLFFAENAGVLLEGSNMFVANADGYIRINLACPQSILTEGLERITKAINEI